MNILKKLWSLAFGPDPGKRAPRPRTRTVLGVEQLDERIVPSAAPQEVDPNGIVYMVRPSGTWGVNVYTDQWHLISQNKASVMDEGANGHFYGAFHDGTFKYNWWSNTWTKLTSAKPTVLDVANDNTLFGTFGNGTFEFDGTWHLLTSLKASDIAAVSNNRAYLEFNQAWNGNEGVWEWRNNNWLQRSTAQAVAMDAAQDGTLFVSYVTGGTYRLAKDGGVSTWLASNIAGAVAAKSFHSAAFSFSTGTFGWNGTDGFKLYTTTSTTQLHFEGGWGIVGVFNTGTFLIQDADELGHGGAVLRKLTSTKALLL